jgi:hypothetical protein
MTTELVRRLVRFVAVIHPARGACLLMLLAAARIRA